MERIWRHLRDIAFLLALIIVFFAGTYYTPIKHGNRLNADTEVSKTNENILEFSLKSPKIQWFRAKVIEIIDGDTYEVLVDRGQGYYQMTTVRLDGVDTPETYNRLATEVD